MESATDRPDAAALAKCVLDAWNSHDVEKVLACYTEDLTYLDPNTRGHVHGSAAMHRYLTKLFAVWRMHWTVREVFPLEHQPGFSVLWHATLRRRSGGQVVQADGMELILMSRNRIARSEVYFDRAVLAPRMTTEAT